VVNVELAEFLKVNKMNHEVRKAALDYEIFNSFAFEIIYTNGGELSSVKHIPVHKLRVGIETDELNFPYFYIPMTGLITEKKEMNFKQLENITLT